MPFSEFSPGLESPFLIALPRKFVGEKVLSSYRVTFSIRKAPCLFPASSCLGQGVISNSLSDCHPQRLLRLASRPASIFCLGDIFSAIFFPSALNALSGLSTLNPPSQLSTPDSILRVTHLSSNFKEQSPWLLDLLIACSLFSLFVVLKKGLFAM